MKEYKTILFKIVVFLFTYVIGMMIIFTNKNDIQLAIMFCLSMIMLVYIKKRNDFKKLAII